MRPPGLLILASTPPALIVLGAMLAGSPSEPPKITPEEAFRADFDPLAAQQAAASSAEHWHATYNCVTCHTNGLFLVAGSTTKALKEPYDRTRSFAHSYLKRYLEAGQTPAGQHGAVEGIAATSAFLAIGEARNGGSVSPETLAALRHAVDRLDPTGHYADWLTCDWPPYEVDHHFGTTLLLVALGGTPESFQTNLEIAPHLRNMRNWLTKNPPENAHQAGMCLWADATGGLSLTDEQRKQYIRSCRTGQQADGGWSVLSIGGWLRPDGTPQIKDSEAYATAFMIFALRQAGVPAEDEGIQRGLTWLRANQRASGRWFNRSPRRDRMHFLSNAATNFALLAFESCEPQKNESPGQDQSSGS